MSAMLGIVPASNLLLQTHQPTLQAAERRSQAARSETLERLVQESLAASL
jgi:hypothetical protein